MKKTIFILLFCVYTANLFSQDTIVVFDGGTYIGKVLEVSPTEIKFILNHSIRADDTIKRNLKYIAYVKYGNGTKEIFNEKRKDIIIPQPKPKKTPISSPLDVADYKKHRLSFSVNIIPLIIKERSIYIDYLYNYRHSFGICVGQIFANKVLQNIRGWVNTIDENNNPGTIYTGMVARLNYKFYFNHQRRQYVGAELSYHYESYSSTMLYVSIRDQGDNFGFNDFLRSEYFNEYGVSVLYGIHLLPTNKICNIEVFGALGIQERIRNYNTYTSTANFYWRNKDIQPIGSYSKSVTYPIITIGFKIGVNAFFK